MESQSAENCLDGESDEHLAPLSKAEVVRLANKAGSEGSEISLMANVSRFFADAYCKYPRKYDDRDS